MSRKAFTSKRGALPIGSYSSAMEAGGLVFLAGQTIEVDAILARRT